VPLLIVNGDLAVPSRTEPVSHKAAEPAGAAGRQPDGTAWRLPGWLVVGIPVAAALLVGGYRFGSAPLWLD
jgi:hypothetical protein